MSKKKNKNNKPVYRDRLSYDDWYRKNRWQSPCLAYELYIITITIYLHNIIIIPTYVVSVCNNIIITGKLPRCVMDVYIHNYNNAHSEKNFGGCLGTSSQASHGIMNLSNNSYYYQINKEWSNVAKERKLILYTCMPYTVL